MITEKWGLLSGPIVVDCNADGLGWPPPSVCYFVSPSGQMVPDAERKARLIAAAPDMLSALRDALDYVERYADLNDESADGDCSQTAQRMRTAIARASQP